MFCAVYIQGRVIQGRVAKKILAHILQAVSWGTDCEPTEEPVLQKMTCEDIGDELPLQHYALSEWVCGSGGPLTLPHTTQDISTARSKYGLSPDFLLGKNV